MNNEKATLILEELKHILESFLADYQYQPGICHRLFLGVCESDVIPDMDDLRKALEVSGLIPSGDDDYGPNEALFRGASTVINQGKTLSCYFINGEGLPQLRSYYAREIMNITDPDEVEQVTWLNSATYDAYALCTDSDGELERDDFPAELVEELETFSNRRCEAILYAIERVESGLVNLTKGQAA